MWAFRRDPESLSAEEKQALEALFEKIPALRALYKVRLRFKEIFDTAARPNHGRALVEGTSPSSAARLGLDLEPFFETYDRWKTEILNYFDARQTSAAVEGINNKARVITKRSLWIEVSEEPVGPIDPGLESGVGSDRLLDRSDPPDGQGPEGPIRRVLHLKTEELIFEKGIDHRQKTFNHWDHNEQRQDDAGRSNEQASPVPRNDAPGR